MKPFISHDGQGAEVRVQISTGIVKNIDLNEDTGNAQITFNVEGLKFPPKAWTNKREEAYNILEKAKDTADPIDFRIESQRKQHVDIKIPIEELLANEPGKNVRSILAGVRYNTPEWNLTTEAVTDPEADPQKAGGRVSAIGKTPVGGATSSENTRSGNAEAALEKLREAADSESLTESVIAALTAEALLRGASIDQVHETIAGKDRRVREQPPTRVSIATESPAWKAWNGDGRPNLGRLDVLAAAGVEKFVRANFKKPQAFNDPAVTFDEEKIIYYTRVLLGIADLVQTRAYGDGFKADRGSSSHSTIRGIVYDTIDNYVPFPNAHDDENTWIKRVGELVTNRFNLILETANENYTLAQIPAPGSNDNVTQNAALEPTPVAPVLQKTEPEPTPEPVLTTPVAVPATEQPETSTPVIADLDPTELDHPAKPVETLTSVATPEPEDDLVREPITDPDYDIMDDEVDADSTAEDSERYYPEEPIDESLLDENNNIDPVLAPSKETQEEFKKLAKDAELDQQGLRKLVTLLEETFGPKFGRISRIPDDELGAFVDFYAATGADNFRRVVESMP